MKRTLEIIIANPAGNITIFVKSPCNRKEYGKIADALLSIKEFCGEQVGFILPTEYSHEENREGIINLLISGKMEMSGLEFCGNASRSFGLILAREHMQKGNQKVLVDVSGSNSNLYVEVNTETNYTKIEMPLAKSIYPGKKFARVKDTPALLCNSTVVDLGGILHIITDDATATLEVFNQIKEFIYGKGITSVPTFLNSPPPALGVMFCRNNRTIIEPVVYVHDIDTTYFEGSCGSGTTAVAIASAISDIKKDPGKTEFLYTVKQPRGTINSTVTMEGQTVKSVTIEGPVQLDGPITIEVDI